MRTVRLGRTDLDVTPIAFGTWQLGGDWGRFDEREAVAAIRQARELGINLFDTAQAYGFGASEQLTEIARQMVGRWGMSSAVGPVAVLPSDGRPLQPRVAGASEETNRIVDEEVRRIVDGALDDVSALLAEHRDQLEALAGALMEHETLDEAEAYAAAHVEHAAAAVS
jgi:aryl-alcohol dehydrogenase-like predicted oxidoreductase